MGHARRKSPVDVVVDDATGCWVWQGYLTIHGYGLKMIGRRRYSAHRLYYESAYGPIPKGLVIDHLCRNRACVNPDHMEVVTQTENCRRSITTKLTEEKAADITRLVKHEHLTQAAVASMYGVTQSCVSAIINKRRWSDIDA